MKSCFTIWAVVCALAALRPLPTRAQDPPESIRVELSPAVEPKPALQYRLRPAFIDLRPGNAAVYYGKVTAEQLNYFGNRELWQKIDEWQGMPLDELRDAPNVENAVTSSPIFSFLKAAAHCETCDWQLPVREGNFYLMLLPEVQQTRQFGRMLTVRARLQIAKGDYAGALETLQVGFALARNVGDGPTVINALVGTAISNQLANQIETMIQQPDCPNLYWALTGLPSPLINLEPGLDAEYWAMHVLVPEMRNPEDMTQSAEYWQAALRNLWKAMEDLDSGPSKFSDELLVWQIMAGYPQAKADLIQWGVPQDQVEAMPVAHVVFWHVTRTFETLRDDLYKWLQLPYSQSHGSIEAAETQILESQEVLPLGRLILPALFAARTAVVHTDRRIAALRTIEAIRMYAAEHDGQLPERLDEITRVPVPIDPATNQPFRYQRTGDTAVLEGVSLPNRPLRYEIQIRRTGGN
jgi:hypothetical protein